MAAIEVSLVILAGRVPVTLLARLEASALHRAASRWLLVAGAAFTGATSIVVVSAASADWQRRLAVGDQAAPECPK